MLHYVECSFVKMYYYPRKGTKIAMKRLVYDRLVKWKNKTDRKPLILYGARQVGNYVKTKIM